MIDAFTHIIKTHLNAKLGTSPDSFVLHISQVHYIERGDSSKVFGMLHRRAHKESLNVNVCQRRTNTSCGWHKRGPLYLKSKIHFR